MPPPERLIDSPPPSYTQARLQDVKDQISGRLDRFGQQASGQLRNLFVKNYNKACFIPGSICCGVGFTAACVDGLSATIMGATGTIPPLGCSTAQATCLTVGVTTSATGLAGAVGFGLLGGFLYCTNSDRQVIANQFMQEVRVNPPSYVPPPLYQVQTEVITAQPQARTAF